MHTGADTAFDAFVEREHQALLRLARLLEDDPQDADLVLRRALARVRRRWRSSSRRGDPAAAARAAVVREVLARRPTDGPRSSGWVDDFEAAWQADDGSDELRRALAELPLRTRTATVLVHGAGLPVEDVARLLRDDLDAVRAEVTAGTARLASALTPAHSGWHLGSRPAGPAPAEDLAHRLAVLADDSVREPVPAVLADTARRDARAVRRRRVAAACVAVAIAVPLLVQSGPPGGTAARPAAEPAPRTERPALPVDVFALPVRGSLAADEAFLSGLRAIEWTSREEWGLPPEYWPRPEERRVLFAGDVPGARWALVVGPPAPGDFNQGPVFEDEVVMAWFTGPRGAAPSEMVLSSYPYTVSPGVLPSLVDPVTGTMVVLAAPGDVVEVSARPEVGADGSRTRSWQRIESGDGVAVARLEPTGMPWMWSASFRVVREDPATGTMTTGVPDVLVADEDAELPPLTVRYPGGSPPAGQQQVAEDAAGMVLTQLGLSPGDVRITALVTAEMPTAGPGELALVGVRVPSGAVVLTASWTRTLPDGSTATMGECGTDVRAAGEPVTRRVVAATCEVWDPATGAPEGSVLVVSAPPSVAAVRIYDGDGTYLAEHPVRDGRLVVPMTTGADEIEAVTGDGVLLGRSDLLTTGVWLGE